MNIICYNIIMFIIIPAIASFLNFAWKVPSAMLTTRYHMFRANEKNAASYSKLKSCRSIVLMSLNAIIIIL